MDRKVLLRIDSLLTHIDEVLEDTKDVSLDELMKEIDKQLTSNKKDQEKNLGLFQLFCLLAEQCSPVIEVCFAGWVIN